MLIKRYKTTNALRQFNIFNNNANCYLNLYADSTVSVLNQPNFFLFLGLFTQHGKLSLLFKHLNFKILTNLQMFNTVVLNLNLNFHDTNLFFFETLFNWLWKDLSIAYRVKYSRLNKKIRKIVKNKYRYQKRYEWIPPHLRNNNSSFFFKKSVLTSNALSFSDRIMSTVYDHIKNSSNSTLNLTMQKTQSLAVSTLAQTKVKL